MTDRVLVEALRRRDPGALAALYDTYAESIHEFCLLSLGNLDGAQVALRDTLIAAEAHIAALADPARLRVWLFTLARAECGRRRMPAALSGTPPIAAQAPAVPDLEGAASADLRFMAWNAAWSLTAADREILYLTVRHHLTPAEIAVVTASSAREIEAGLGVARDRLRDAVTAEVLARKGPYDCPRRADILTGFAGELTPAMREQVVRHLARCDTCAPHRARQVSAAKVFDLLPAVPLPESLRVRVMSCFTDPELVAYRRYVARRVGLLDAAGFPAAGIKGDRRRHRVVALALVAAVATLIAATATVTAAHWGSGGPPPEGVLGVASRALPPTGGPAAKPPPWAPGPREVPADMHSSAARSPVDPGLRATVPVPEPALSAGTRTPYPSPPPSPPSPSSRPSGPSDTPATAPSARPSPPPSTLAPVPDRDRDRDRERDRGRDRGRGRDHGWGHDRDRPRPRPDHHHGHPNPKPSPSASPTTTPSSPTSSPRPTPTSAPPSPSTPPPSATA